MPGKTNIDQPDAPKHTIDDCINDFLLLCLAPRLEEVLELMPGTGNAWEEEARTKMLKLLRYSRKLRNWMIEDGRVPPERSKLFPVGEIPKAMEVTTP